MPQRTEIRNAYMKNFSKYVEERYVLISESLMNINHQDTLIHDVNEELWHAIQELNLRITDRVVPFIKVTRVIKEQGDRLRIVLDEMYPREKNRETTLLDDVCVADTSHLIDFRYIAPYRRITVSDIYTDCNAKLMIDPEMLANAMIDVFLDIAMFHSFSSLEMLTLSQKREFSKQKLEFYKEKSLDSYYELYLEGGKEPSYFSLAFCCRTGLKTFDYDQYIWLWDIFLKQFKYSTESVVMEPHRMIEKYHVDVKNLAGELQDGLYWEKQSEGALLLLRTISRPNDTLRRQWLCDYFGTDKYYVGMTKVVRLSEIRNTMLERELRELNVSAFKVINKHTCIRPGG